jgi:general secretion pathway protein F
VTTYVYEAVRTDGATVRGTIDAMSESDAAGLVSARGLLPIGVKAALPSKKLFAHPSRRALATTFSGLAALVDTGVPLHKALLAVQAVAPPQLRSVLERVETHVREGASLATVLGHEAGTVPAVAIGLIRAGERGIGLGVALQQVANQLEREAESIARVRAALAYPALLLMIGSTSVAMIAVLVVPRFAALLGDLGQQLPSATLALMAISDVLQHYGVLLGLLGMALAAALLRWTVEHRVVWHRFLLDLPVIGPLRLSLATARVSRTLGALLGTGTPALAALATAREAAGDAAIAERIDAARGRVAQGAGLTTALEASRVITESALRLSAIGEGSGRLPTLLAKAADLEEQDADRRLKLVVSLLEPGLIVTFASIVAFVAAALLQAVYALRP